MFFSRMPGTCGPLVHYYLCTWRQSFDDAVDFVGLVRRGSDFGHDDVRVESPVELGTVPFHPDQAVLFAVVQPVPGASRPDDPLEL